MSRGVRAACDCRVALVLCAWVVSVASCSGACVSCVVSSGELVAWCFAWWGFVVLRLGAMLLLGTSCCVLLWGVMRCCVGGVMLRWVPVSGVWVCRVRFEACFFCCSAALVETERGVGASGFRGACFCVRLRRGFCCVGSGRLCPTSPLWRVCAVCVGVAGRGQPSFGPPHV